MTSAAIPTKPGIWRRIHTAVRVAYLKHRIAAAEKDAEMHEYHAMSEPLMATHARDYAARLRNRLARIEQGSKD